MPLMHFLVFTDRKLKLREKIAVLCGRPDPRVSHSLRVTLEEPPRHSITVNSPFEGVGCWTYDGHLIWMGDALDPLDQQPEGWTDRVTIDSEGFGQIEED